MELRLFNIKDARWPRGTDKLFVRRIGEKQYEVQNRAKNTRNVVTFSRSTTQRNLFHCTCADFSINRATCKHSFVSAKLHVFVQKARAGFFSKNC